ncbi:hypothetical protein BH20VER3_BH20VER3_08810 [soil metagenome]
MTKTNAVDEIELVPFDIFRKKAKNAIAQSKEQSDKELAKFQAANVRKREARKKKLRSAS